MRINETKAKNKELEKFKYVLDYKLQLMKNEIEPRDVQIGDLKDSISDLDQELQHDLRINFQLERQVCRLSLLVCFRLESVVVCR